MSAVGSKRKNQDIIKKDSKLTKYDPIISNFIVMENRDLDLINKTYNIVSIFFYLCANFYKSIFIRTYTFEKNISSNSRNNTSISIYKSLQNEQSEKLCICKRYNAETKVMDSMICELATLTKLNHQNIIKPIVIFSGNTSIYSIMEYFPFTIADIINDTKKVINISLIKVYMWQILQGVKHCHDNNIIHRDLKANNIFVRNDDTLVIADFDLSKSSKSEIYSKQMVTMWYRAPEVLYGSGNYNCQIDIWSIGCIFAELFLRSNLIKGNQIEHVIIEIFSILGTPTISEFPMISEYYSGYIEKNLIYPKSNYLESFIYDPVALDLIYKMLEYNPSKRISAKEALEHPFFSIVSESKLNLTEDALAVQKFDTISIPLYSPYFSNIINQLGEQREISNIELKEVELWCNSKEHYLNFPNIGLYKKYFKTIFDYNSKNSNFPFLFKSNVLLVIGICMNIELKLFYNSYETINLDEEFKFRYNSDYIYKLERCILYILSWDLHE
jgi:serine/threonine protein kinase